MQLHPFFLIAAVASVSVVPLAAHAAPPAKSDVATDKARELHVEGDEFYKKADYARARVSYIAAWALKKNWQLAGSLGDCELKLGMNRDAAEHLAYFLRVSPNQPPAPAAKKLYEDARATIAALTIRVDTPGADVAVDGKWVGKSPLEDPVFIEPGHHSIEARFADGRATEDAEVQRGTERTLNLSLKDGPSPSSRSIVPGLVLAGAGVAALATGVGLTLAANGRSSEATSLRAQVGDNWTCTATPQSSTCIDLNRALDNKVTFSNAAMASFLAGGALAVAGAGLSIWAVSAKKDVGASVRVGPIVGARQGGVVVVGSW
jgi:hypothetical protein